MKRTPLKRRTPFKKRKPFRLNKNSAWTVARARLKRIFYDKGITNCEIGLPGCVQYTMLSFAHRHKRIWYANDENRTKLGDFDQVLLACIPCHQVIEDSRELTEKYFKLRRGI